MARAKVDTGECPARGEGAGHVYFYGMTNTLHCRYCGKNLPDLGPPDPDLQRDIEQTDNPHYGSDYPKEPEDK